MPTTHADWCAAARLLEENGFPVQAALLREGTTAFLTGSRAYGTPREDSDVDLCLTVSERDFTILNDLADRGQRTSGRPGCVGGLRYGRLNLICVTTPDLENWRRGTRALEARQPVTREEAIRVLGEHGCGWQSQGTAQTILADTPPEPMEYLGHLPRPNLDNIRETAEAMPF